MRCIFESLALKYHFVLGHLEALVGHPIEIIHIIGGGSQNDLLNQLTADASQKIVTSGPVEATALGNALVQGISLGFFRNMNEARQAVARQTSQKRFEPRKDYGWDEALSRFLVILQQR